MKLKSLVGTVASAAALLVGGQASAIPVALELALLVDTSGSVTAAEYALQRDGYMNAFLNATVQANIATLTGGIAVLYMEWSGTGQQIVKQNWIHISNAAQATAFANTIGTFTQAFSGSTAPGSALNFATPLFGTETGGAANGFESARQVIDVSGDGAENVGANTLAARNAALAAGVDTINGLAILGEAGLATFYQNNIVGGTNAFLEIAANFTDFQDAVIRKIGREIINVPEPGSLALVGLALAAVGVATRRKA